MEVFSKTSAMIILTLVIVILSYNIFVLNRYELPLDHQRPIRKSEFAYVTAISDYSVRYIIYAMVLGQSIVNTQTKNDIIVLIPERQKHKFGRYEITNLKNIFTHIVYMPDITFARSEDNHFWFKINAWRLSDYERIIWIGADCLVLRNIDNVFLFPAPCATQDMILFGQPSSAFGTVFNGDFIMFKPSLEEFDKLVRLNYIMQAFDAHSEVGNSFGKKIWLGPFDQALLNIYYGNTITRLPLNFLYQSPQCLSAFVDDPSTEQYNVIHFANLKPDISVPTSVPSFYRLWMDVYIILKKRKLLKYSIKPSMTFEGTHTQNGCETYFRAPVWDKSFDEHLMNYSILSKQPHELWVSGMLPLKLFKECGYGRNSCTCQMTPWLKRINLDGYSHLPENVRRTVFCRY